MWSALTEPSRLADWMGAAYVEPHAGGRYEVMLDAPRPMTGHILVWEPPHVLEISWRNAHAPDSVVRYELSAQGDGARMIFTHKGIPYANSALMLPGWHVFFERLGGTLDEAATRAGPSWREMQAIYVERYRFDGVTLDP